MRPLWGKKAREAVNITSGAQGDQEMFFYDFSGPGGGEGGSPLLAAFESRKEVGIWAGFNI